MVLTIIMYMYSWSLNIKLITCTVHVSQMIPYSGKFSNGAKFRIIRIGKHCLKF